MENTSNKEKEALSILSEALSAPYSWQSILKPDKKTLSQVLAGKKWKELKEQFIKDYTIATTDFSIDLPGNKPAIFDSVRGRYYGNIYHQIGIDIPIIDNIDKKDGKKIWLFTSDTHLMEAVANTDDNIALDLFNEEIKADPNKYSALYGNNPLWLASFKGSKHERTDTKNIENSDKGYQQNILELLLKQKEINPNLAHLADGTTPLHIAFLKADLWLIEKLLNHPKINQKAKDYHENLPADMLNKSYEDMINYMKKICSTDKEETVEFLSYLPKLEEREKNVAKIKDTFKLIYNDHSCCSCAVL